MAVARIYQYCQKHGIAKVAILTVSSAFGVAGKEQLLGQAAKFGMEVVGQEVFGDKDTDMTPQLTKMRSLPAQAVICWGVGPAPALVAKNMKQLGLTIPLIQSHGAASKKFIELAAEAGKAEGGHGPNLGRSPAGAQGRPPTVNAVRRDFGFPRLPRDRFRAS